jgi:hypothetical protein
MILHAVARPSQAPAFHRKPPRSVAPMSQACSSSLNCLIAVFRAGGDPAKLLAAVNRVLDAGRSSQELARDRGGEMARGSFRRLQGGCPRHASGKTSIARHSAVLSDH